VHNTPEVIRKRFLAWKNDRDVEILEALEAYFDKSNTADSYQSYSIASPEGVLEVIRPWLAAEPSNKSDVKRPPCQAMGHYD